MLDPTETARGLLKIASCRVEESERPEAEFLSTQESQNHSSSEMTVWRNHSYSISRFLTYIEHIWQMLIIWKNLCDLPSAPVFLLNSHHHVTDSHGSRMQNVLPINVVLLSSEGLTR